MQQFGFVNILIGLLESLEENQYLQENESEQEQNNKHEQEQNNKHEQSEKEEDLSTLLARSIANLSGRFSSQGTKRCWKFLDDKKNQKLSLIIHEPSFLSSDVGSLV